MITAQEEARLTWSCRRGMLELDLILNKFMKKGLALLSSEQIACFNTLLTHSDPDLYVWLMGYEEPSDRELQPLVAFIRDHS